ncbi:MAG: hypothetical protein P9L97_05730 [Candidatus Tenebribacter davisii]|nr:hypothetical protein [Candidatus Tenebribacter davisii]
MTICDCKVCQAIKRRIENSKHKHPLCPYCNDHHDHRIHCIAEFGKAELGRKNGYEKLKETMHIKETQKIRAEWGLPGHFEENCEYFLDIDNGKYTIYQNKQDGFKALRYSEDWRDLTGDNLVYCMMVELIEANAKIERAIEAVNNMELDENVIDILKGKR